MHVRSTGRLRLFLSDFELQSSASLLHVFRVFSSSKGHVKNHVVWRRFAAVQERAAVWGTFAPAITATANKAPAQQHRHRHRLPWLRWEQQRLCIPWYPFPHPALRRLDMCHLSPFNEIIWKITLFFYIVTLLLHPKTPCIKPTKPLTSRTRKERKLTRSKDVLLSYSAHAWW